MVIDRPSRVTGRILLLGRQESCVYLLDGGGEYALLGGGMTYTIPDVVRQLESFRIDETRISRMIILHSHFDHVGMIPYLKKRWPQAAVCASERGRTQLLRPEIVNSIIGFNRLMLQQAGINTPEEDLGLPFDHLPVDEVLTDGERITCGEVTMEVIETPGHSSCSLTVYVPEEKALFSSDSLGIPYMDTVFTSANSNFDEYQKSLEKLAGYDIAALLAEHYGALTGEDARTFISRSMESARITRKIIRDTYEKTRDETRTVEEVTSLFLEEGSGYFLPREVVELVVGQMTRFLAKSME
jgi:glyoxylase-like metal-dependent hydrolase (beta-lactamase superfamily II)